MPPPVPRIAPARAQDLDATLEIERRAFGREDEARLVAALLQDPTAQPCLSLLAFIADRPVGHVLFTALHLATTAGTIVCSILAPLAVVPERQRAGVGRALIERGAELLAARGVSLVFVLGDPAYYGRHRFEPAVPHGLLPPYTVTPEDAWRVRPLAPGVLGQHRGTLQCAAALAHPEYWRE